MTNDFQPSPLKGDFLAASPQALQQLQQLYRAQTSATSDISSLDFDIRCKNDRDEISAPLSSLGFAFSQSNV